MFKTQVRNPCLIRALPFNYGLEQSLSYHLVVGLHHSELRLPDAEVILSVFKVGSWESGYIVLSPSDFLPDGIIISFKTRKIIEEFLSLAFISILEYFYYTLKNKVVFKTKQQINMNLAME